MRRVQVLVLLLAVACGALARGVDAQTGAPRLDRIDEVTSLIPRNAPALLVANGPFELTPRRTDASPTLGDRLRVEAMGQPQDVLAALRAQAELDVVVQAVAANAPLDEAPGVCNGAHLILFKRGLRARPEAVLSQLRGPNTAPLFVGRVPVAVRWRSGGPGGRFAQYYAMPRPNLFVSSSSLAGLQEIVLRCAAGASGVELPAVLQRYVGHVDTGAPIWAMRRLTDFDYLWRNAPREQWPAALIFNWTVGRGRLGYVGGIGDLPDYAKDQFERYPFRVIRRDFGLIELLQRNGMRNEQFTQILLQGLGYGEG